MSQLGSYLPDVTGINPNYTVTNETYVYFEKGMVLTFPLPVFYDSLKIFSSRDGALWADPKDYQIFERDQTAESIARNLDPNFSGRLVRKIILSADVISPYQIFLSYQTFYPKTPHIPVDAVDGSVELTPALISDILNRLLSVEQKSLTVGATSLPSDIVIRPLKEDIDGVNDDNILTQTFTVNTFQGQNVIFPPQGGFFKDSLVITQNGITLTPDVDYKTAEFDRYRTKITSNRSGIYHALVILRDYAGDLSVKAHYVGGVPTIGDVNTIRTAVSDVITFLKTNQYLTSAMLTTDPKIMAAFARIEKLENQMRAFLDTPTYGKTTTGTTVVRTFKANDTALHWWTIGTLYLVDQNPQIVTADTMKIAIEMPDRHLRADVYISVDITNATQPMKIAASNVFYDQGYTPFSTQSAVTPPPLLFRILYNQTADNSSGITLQVGTSLPSLVERFGITDNSGVESAWFLALPQKNDAAMPDDQYPITLPNPERQWMPGGTQSAMATVTLPLDEGYLLFSGSQDLTSLSAPNANSSNPFTVQPVVPGWLPISQSTAIDLFYTLKQSDGVTKRGKLRLPALYDASHDAVYAQTSVTDLGFSDGSVGTIRMSLTKNTLSMYYVGTPESQGLFTINYITLHTGTSSEVLKPFPTGQ